MKNEILDELIESLQILQGVGVKTAKRYAFDILESPLENKKALIKNLEKLNEIKKCKVCGCYTQNEMCDYCLDPARNSGKLIVLAWAKDVFKIEELLPNQFKYFVLGNVIDPLNGVTPDSLRITELEEYIKTQPFSELIFVLPVTSEGEITYSYITKRFEKYSIKFSKLAQGVPIGANIEYIDEITLLRSFENRS